jgi:exodeoxyribonuclease-5
MQYEFRGRKVKVDLNLNDEQIAAVEEIVDFIQSDRTCLTLMGYAGTGKTTLMGIVRDIFHHDIRLQFAATTHKAAGVLKEKVNESVSTVNSLFGIVVEQDFDVENFDVSLKKRREGDNKLMRGSVVIIDEASMLSEENFADVMEKCQDFHCKVIFVGDPAQLAPVKEDDISIVFRQDLGKIIKLTKVERTGDNGILKEATAIRNGSNLSYEDGNGITFLDNTEGQKIANVFDEFIPGLKENPNYFRVLSFTNKNVENLNFAIRKKLGYDGLDPQEGEPMMSYANWGYDYLKRYTGTPYRFVNSESYQVVGIDKEEVKDVMNYVEFEYSGDVEIPITIKRIKLKDALGLFVTVPYIDVKNNQNNFRAAKLLSYQKQLLWNKWKTASLNDKPNFIARINEIDNMLFVNDNIRDNYGFLLQGKVIDYGYAHTIHKSQGSTFNNVLINDVDICSCMDKKMRQQLRYVAITRASDNVNIIVKK